MTHDAAIRPATAADLPFLLEMLYEAAYWRPGAPRPPMDEGLSHPDLAKLLQDWGRPGDAGVIAESVTGERLGAAWYRFWTGESHSYGFVDAGTPELGIAVKAAVRGQGLGRRLLLALLDRARTEGIARISLSVEVANPARALYQQCGFTAVSAGGGAETMVRRLA